MTWEAVVGLEIHAQLATRSKIFSGAPAAVGAEPNRQACAIDLGLPGVLPVLNAEVLRMAVMFGLATNAEIAPSRYSPARTTSTRIFPRDIRSVSTSFPSCSAGRSRSI